MPLASERWRGRAEYTPLVMDRLPDLWCGMRAWESGHRMGLRAWWRKQRSAGYADLWREYKRDSFALIVEIQSRPVFQFDAKNKSAVAAEVNAVKAATLKASVRNQRVPVDSRGGVLGRSPAADPVAIAASMIEKITRRNR